jgi:hypothetical protein
LVQLLESRRLLSVTIIDDGDAGWASLGPWSTSSLGGFQGDSRTSTGSQSSATWTFSVAPGTYYVYATWPSHGTSSTGATYVTLDDASSLGTVVVNQRVEPNDLTADGAVWEQLGGPYTLTSSTLAVRLQNAPGPSTGPLLADAVRIGDAADSLAPPVGLTATATSPTTIQVAWQDPVGVTGYRVERSIFGFDWAPIGSVAPDVTTFTDSGLTEGSSYRYRVIATRTSGDSTPSEVVYGVIPWSTPIVVTPASANPALVTGTETTLSVLGDVAAGESTLTYTWSVTSIPAGALYPSFDESGTNAAKTMTVTFSSAGNYTFRATIANGSQPVTSDVTVTVQQMLTSIVVSPPYAIVPNGATRQFEATAKDQFEHDLQTQPQFTWSLVGGIGQVSSAGLYMAPAVQSGDVEIRATAATDLQVSGTANVAVPSYDSLSLDFGGLPYGTQVTDQYPFTTFSAGPGQIVIADQRSNGVTGYVNLLTVTPPTGFRTLNIDFATPMHDVYLRTWTNYAYSGPATVSVYQNGQHSATITSPLTVFGEIVNLENYPGITRIEISSSEMYWSLWQLSFRDPQFGVNLTAHRTGGMLGQVVPEWIEDGGDTTNYVILTNSEPDFADATAVIPTGSASSGEDDDLAQITLERIPSGLTEGSIEIRLSNQYAGRLFKSDGSLLAGADLTLDLANPSGYLAGLMTGDVDVWLEGIRRDDDFVFSFVRKNRNGQIVASDDVHMLIADWTFRGYYGQEVVDVAPVWQEALRAATMSL